MTPRENNLKTLERIRDKLNKAISAIDRDIEDIEFDERDLASVLPAKKQSVTDALANSKRACQEASDFRRYLEARPDHGTGFQNDELKELFEKAKTAKANVEELEKLLNVHEDRSLELKERRQNVLDRRTETVKERDGVLRDIEELLKAP